MHRRPARIGSRVIAVPGSRCDADSTKMTCSPATPTLLLGHTDTTSCTSGRVLASLPHHAKCWHRWAHG
eukprot:349946-Chlamydomonas_euryale.AAC.7